MNEVTLRVRCRQTSDVVELPLRAARLAGSVREPWVAYDCPSCLHLEGVAVAGKIADELRRHGMARADQSLPIEMLEPHPAGDLDDTWIDAYLAGLATTDELVAALAAETIGDAA